MEVLLICYFKSKKGREEWKNLAKSLYPELDILEDKEFENIFGTAIILQPGYIITNFSEERLPYLEINNSGIELELPINYSVRIDKI